MEKILSELNIFVSDGNYSSKYPRSDEFVSEGVPFIRGNNMVDGSIDDNEMYYITPEKHSVLQKGHVKAGDVLITTRGNIGQTAIVPDNHNDSNINAQIVLLRVDNKTLNNKYLMYSLQSATCKEQFISLETGTALKQLPVKRLMQVKIPYYPISDQMKIAKVIDETLNILRRKKEILTELDYLVKSRFVEMFGEMDSLNPIDKQTLGEVCDVRDGTHDSPKYYNEGYPLVTSKNVTSGEIDFSSCNLISIEDFNKINARSKVDIGDILMPMIGTVGKPVIVNTSKEFAIKNVALIKFRENSCVTNVFIKALLESNYFDRAVLSKIRGGTQKFISLGDVRKLELMVPSLAMQNNFSEFVKQVDKSKFKIIQCTFYVNSLHCFDSPLHSA